MRGLKVSLRLSRNLIKKKKKVSIVSPLRIAKYSKGTNII